jgi:hypothetical protein
MAQPKRCGNCGSKHIQKIDKSGLTLPWKDYPAVLISQPVNGFKCENCGELILNATQGKDLDAKIEASIVEAVQSYLALILQREKCEQKDIAAHLGVSPEYLSEIKSGRKLPKFQTFNFLKTLAHDANSFKVSDPTYRPKRATA